jgi:acyl-CoA oxidase
MFLRQALTRQRLAGGIARRGFASSWTDEFLDVTKDIRGDWSFNESADRLRAICKADLVKGTDIQDDPARFFKAHRILARHATNHGPG